MIYRKEKLVAIIQKQALLFGDFILKSGCHSSYYIDIRRVTLDSVGLAQIVLGIQNTVYDIDFNAIAGPSIGADPIIGGCLQTCGLGLFEQPKAGYMVRSTPKDHGTKSLIEGCGIEGKKVLIVEDVTTTGKSTWDTIQAVETANGKIAAVVTVLDRLQGAQALLHGYKFFALTTIQDLNLRGTSNG